MLPSVNWRSGNWLRDLFLSCVLALWVYQLLAPLAKTGGINDMSTFFAFVAGLLLIDLIMPWRLPRVIIKAALLAVFMYLMFFSEMEFWHGSWLLTLLANIEQGTFYALQRKYLSVNPLAQTFFFYAVSVDYSFGVQECNGQPLLAVHTALYRRSGNRCN